MRARRPKTRRHGTVMMETVLVLPLVLLILALLFFFGRLVVSINTAQQIARYEAWRHSIGGSGPKGQLTSAADETEQLHDTFVGDDAVELTHYIATGDEAFPVNAHEELIGEADGVSEDAGTLAEALVYEPESDEERMPNGHQEGFVVDYPLNFPLAGRVDREVMRMQARIGHEWRFSSSQTACADEWRGGRESDHHPRAIRDVFYMDFDAGLDDLDGDTDTEYDEGNDDEEDDPGTGSDETQRFNNEVLAGFIRSLYLERPSYRGPIVHDEQAQ